MHRLTACAAAFLALITPAAAADLIVGPQPQAVVDRILPEPPGYVVNTWTRGLQVPWSLVFLPDGRALVSERAGRIRLIDRDGTLRPAPFATVDVFERGEGGLLGLALHPGFPAQPYVYAYRTVNGPHGRENQVIRLIAEGDTGRFDRVILGGIPAADYHDGGRIAFGPDGMLYIGAGDNFLSHLAQSLTSMAGKVLRVTPEGQVPPDNPFPGSPVWSYGNRNPQGLAWHPVTGDLFETEHGPTGEVGNAQAHDEINVIRRGGNYGWPLAIGAPGRPGLVDPLVVWPGPSTPPSGATFWHGALFVATLRSQALLRIELDAAAGGGYAVRSIERWFANSLDWGRFGRLRDVVVGPDDALYVLTNDRGDDDLILRIAPG